VGRPGRTRYHRQIQTGWQISVACSPSIVGSCRLGPEDHRLLCSHDCFAIWRTGIVLSLRAGCPGVRLHFVAVIWLAGGKISLHTACSGRGRKSSEDARPPIGSGAGSTKSTGGPPRRASVPARLTKSVSPTKISRTFALWVVCSARDAHAACRMDSVSPPAARADIPPAPVGFVRYSRHMEHSRWQGKVPDC